jgi:hypothetical protein
VIASTSAITTSCAKNCVDPAGTAPNASRITASVPGPAISGNASGNTEMSALCWHSASSPGVVDLAPDGRANTISIASRNNRMPPPILNASMLMPSILSSIPPHTANAKLTIAAIVTALIDMRLRCASPVPSVSPARIGSNDSGSTTTSRTTKNFINSSNIGDGDNSPLALAASQDYNVSRTGRTHGTEA